MKILQIADDRQLYTLHYPMEPCDILQVIKKKFMNVLGITKRRIKTIVKAKNSEELTFTEKRGNKKKKVVFER